MQVSQLTINNFRGIRKAALQFSGHTLLIGGNNVGKSTICEALDLVLGPDRLNRTPPVEEFDFRNAGYLAEDGETVVPIRIEAILILTDLTTDIKTSRRCAPPILSSGTRPTSACSPKARLLRRTIRTSSCVCV